MLSLNEAQDARWWITVQQQTTRDIKIEKFISHRSWKSPQHTSGGTQRGQGRMQTETEAGPRSRTLLRFMGRVLWDSQTRARLVNWNQESGVLVSPMGVLSKGCMRQRHWKAEETIGKSWKYYSIRDLRLLVTLQAAVCIVMRGLVSIQGTWRLLGQRKWKLRQCTME